MAADGVDFVDEDDAGRVLLRLVEHVADAARADADEHFDEIGTRDGEERHIRFARDRAGGQRLTGAGRTDEEHAARNPAAEALELLRIAEELDDLLQVFLGLVDARHIVERDAAMRLGEQLRLGLAEAHGAACAVLHLARHEHPGADEQGNRQDVHEERDEPGGRVGLRPGSDLDALLLKLGDEHRIVGRIGREGPSVRIGAADLRAGNHHVGDAAGIGFAQKLAVGNIAATAALAGTLEQGHERQHQQEDDNPQGEVAEI